MTPGLEFELVAAVFHLVVAGFVEAEEGGYAAGAAFGGGLGRWGTFEGQGRRGGHHLCVSHRPGIGHRHCASTHHNIIGRRLGGGFLEDAGGEDFALEVAAVELDAEDGFVDGLKFWDGEFFAEEVEADRLEMDVAAEPLHCRGEDLAVVEGEGREVVDREPAGFVGIVAAEDVGRPDKGVPGDGDDAFARVAVYVGEDAELFDGGRGEGCFLAELAKGSLLCAFVKSQEASREGPLALVGFSAAPDEQHFQLAFLKSENDAVGGDCHVLVAVLPRVLRPGYVCPVLCHNCHKNMTKREEKQAKA